MLENIEFVDRALDVYGWCLLDDLHRLNAKETVTKYIMHRDKLEPVK